MQFFTIAALFGAAAMAAPAPQTPECSNPAHCGAPNTGSTENVDFSDYTLRRNNGSIQSISFKATGQDATAVTCTGGPYPTLPSEVQACGESKYRFGMYQLENSTDSFGVRFYHELGTAVGLWGEGEVPTFCRAGGDGPQDFICQQSGEYTMVITSSG